LGTAVTPGGFPLFGKSRRDVGAFLEPAGLEEFGDDRRQMDTARGLGHQGFDQVLADALSPEARLDPERAELEAVRMLLEDDEAGDRPGLLNDPETVRLHARIIQIQTSGEFNGAGNVFRAAFSNAHFRLLYHARGPLRRTDIIRVRGRRFLLEWSNF
jgi:hypothetical protein